ncbi:MAG: rRNA maturation RNase YbeY [Spirochaetia bacterium]|nr:rRNA maturation RNase YbeY [Spirochaetia bacterium]
MDSLYIDYESEIDKIIAPIEFVERVATLASSIIGLQEGEVSISFVSQERITELNKDYRNKDESTDILSFVQEDDDENFFSIHEEVILGDIVISLVDMNHNCDYFNVDEKNELIRLIVHGLLHLHGDDHESNKEEEPMLILQENIVKQIEKELGK